MNAFVRRNELFSRVPLAPEAPVPILTPEMQGARTETNGASPNTEVGGRQGEAEPLAR
jgi:hypothetical protein